MANPNAYYPSQADYSDFYAQVTGQDPKTIARDGQLPKSATTYAPVAANPNPYSKVSSDPLQYEMLADQFGLNDTSPTKRVVATTPIRVTINNPVTKSSAYDRVASDPITWQQFDDWSNDPAIRSIYGSAPNSPSRTLIANKDESRLGNTGYLAFTGDQQTGLPNTPATQAIARAMMGSAWNGGWGSDALGRFLAGPHGEVDYTVANPGMEGIRGPVTAGSIRAQTVARRLIPYAGQVPINVTVPVAPTPVPRPVVGYSPLPSDPLQAAVIQAQRDGQVYDRSRDPSFNPNGGAHGGSLAGF